MLQTNIPSLITPVILITSLYYLLYLKWLGNQEEVIILIQSFFTLLFPAKDLTYIPYHPL